MGESDVKDAVYLDDSRFVEWDRPSKIQRPNRFSINPIMLPDASTELISCIGFDVLNEVVGRYHLIASSAKYEAKVAPFGEKTMRDPREDTTIKPEDFLLFVGSMAIYSTDKIPGTELKGYDFIRNGKIFTARKTNEILTSNQGLKNLILEELDGENSIKRVEEIITGYENQRLAEQSSQLKREYNSYKKGDFDRAESSLGTFGRW